MNGVNNVVHNVACKLFEMGESVEVWGVSDIENKNELQRDYILKVFDKFKFRIIPSWAMIKELLGCMKIKNNTIFHFHGSFIIEFFVFSLLLRILGFIWIVTPHGGYSMNSFKKNGILKRLYSKSLDRLYIGKARVIHTLASQENIDFKRCFPNKETMCISNGVDLNYSLVVSPNNVKSKYFVFCGRLSYEKGLDRLLEGYNLYLKKGGDAELVIIGDGDKRDFVEKYAKDNKINEKVKLTGAKFGLDKDKIISRAMACIATSYNEGFPIALLEGLALNKPLIVSKETNIGDLINTYDLGVCLDDCTQESVSDALLYIQDNYMKYGYRPFKFIEDNYTWKHVVESLNNEYDKLIVGEFK